jgi:acyl-CoA thioesterase FadM
LTHREISSRALPVNLHLTNRVNRYLNTYMTSEFFTYRRRIAFGDCDPARIYYTPRAIDYAVEAIEGWCDKVLGFAWGGNDRSEFELSFVRIDCNYLRPLVAGQVVEVRVWVAEVSSSQILFSVYGQNSDGETCFQANLVACFVKRDRFLPLSIPALFRGRIDLYRLQFRETVIEGGGRSVFQSGLDKEPERALPRRGGSGASEVFTRQRRVIYGACGSAGMVYPPRVFDYAVEAIEEWFEVVAGISWMELVCKHGQGAPFVAAGCEYLRPMTPGMDLSIAVRVTRLGGASIGFAVTGHGGDGAPCFQAQLAACFIDQRGFRSIRIPEDIRRRVEAYNGCW